jgi:hypothetical protein
MQELPKVEFAFPGPLRAGHERFWHGDEFRAYLGDPAFTVNDDTIAVTERFKVVERL